MLSLTYKIGEASKLTIDLIPSGSYQPNQLQVQLRGNTHTRRQIPILGSQAEVYEILLETGDISYVAVAETSDRMVYVIQIFCDSTAKDAQNIPRLFSEITQSFRYYQ